MPSNSPSKCPFTPVPALVLSGPTQHRVDYTCLSDPASLPTPSEPKWHFSWVTSCWNSMWTPAFMTAPAQNTEECSRKRLQTHKGKPADTYWHFSRNHFLCMFLNNCLLLPTQLLDTWSLSMLGCAAESMTGSCPAPEAVNQPQTIFMVTGFFPGQPPMQVRFVRSLCDCVHTHFQSREQLWAAVRAASRYWDEILWMLETLNAPLLGWIHRAQTNLSHVHTAFLTAAAFGSF